MDSPFFIVGHPRSGTTLVRAIINSHARLYVPPETGFLPFLQVDGQAPAKDRPLARKEVTSLLQHIGRLNREWQSLVHDTAEFYEALSNGRDGPTVAQVLDALYRRRMGERGERWGDKTPSYVSYIPHIDRLFPEALFVHVIRDGRDTVLSAREKWEGRHHLDSYYLLQRWVENVIAGRRNGRLLGQGRYLEIHYEDLVAQPAESVRQLCDFLGETFRPAMLDHTQQFQEMNTVGGHPEVRRPIFSTSAGRWRREMAPFDRKLAHHLAGPTLHAFGYPTPNPEPWKVRERLRLLLLNIRYRLFAAARRALYAVGILTLNRGKRTKTRQAERRTA